MDQNSSLVVGSSYFDCASLDHYDGFTAGAGAFDSDEISQNDPDGRSLLVSVLELSRVGTPELVDPWSVELSEAWSLSYSEIGVVDSWALSVSSCSKSGVGEQLLEVSWFAV